MTTLAGELRSFIKICKLVDPATENRNPKLASKFSCNFESEIGLCGFKQEDNDNFDWIRHQGRTRSRGTGPSADNTLVSLFGLLL